MAEYVGPDDDGAANVGTVDIGSFRRGTAATN